MRVFSRMLSLPSLMLSLRLPRFPPPPPSPLAPPAPLFPSSSTSSSLRLFPTLALIYSAARFTPVDLLSRRSVIPPLYSERARIAQWTIVYVLEDIYVYVRAHRMCVARHRSYVTYRGSSAICPFPFDLINKRTAREDETSRPVRLIFLLILSIFKHLMIFLYFSFLTYFSSYKACICATKNVIMRKYNLLFLVVFHYYCIRLQMEAIIDIFLFSAVKNF